MRFGILGAANIAKKYTAHAMTASEATELVGVAARDVKRAREFSHNFRCEAFTSYDELVLSDQIDAVYIPLPIAMHGEWGRKALEAGKHVLCEKSLAANLDDALSLIEMARDRGLVLMENFMCERHPQNELVQDALTQGEIGSIQQLSLAFGFPPFDAADLKYSAVMGGGALNDAGAYCVNMASYYLQQLPEAVWCRLQQRGHDVDVTGNASLEYADGTTAQLSFGFDNDYRNEARIWGSAGQIAVDRSFSIPPDRKPSITLTRNTQTTSIDAPAANHFVRTMEAFAKLTHGADHSPTLDKIAAQAMVMEAARRSAAEDRVVRLAEFDGWSALTPWGCA